MAKKKAATKKKTASKTVTNRHKEIDELEDNFERAARVSEETSNDGKFSIYELAEKKDPRDGDTILQYRGEPKA